MASHSARALSATTRFAASVAIATLGAIGGAGVGRVGGVGLQKADAELPAVFVDALDHVPIELKLADDYSGKINPTGAQLVKRNWLLARAP